MKLVKINKRFVIENDGFVLYVLPDHLKKYIKSRKDFDELIFDLNSGMIRIDAVMKFEKGLV